MSWKLQEQARRQRNTTALEARVLGEIARSLKDDGAHVYYPSATELAGHAECTVRHLRNILRSLRDKGLLSWRPGTGRRPNMYTLYLKDFTTTEPPSGDIDEENTHDTTTEPGSGEVNVKGTVADEHPSGEVQFPPGVKSSSPLRTYHGKHSTNGMPRPGSGSEVEMDMTEKVRRLATQLWHSKDRVDYEPYLVDELVDSFPVNLQGAVRAYFRGEAGVEGVLQAAKPENQGVLREAFQRAGLLKEKLELKPRLLECRVCGDRFNYSVKLQEYRLEKGWSDPELCDSCYRKHRD